MNSASEQQRPVVAFQGAPGAFSDEAVRLIWTGQATSAPNRDFLSAVQAIATGRADYAVLPVENSSAGLITGSLE
ncbi:MAG: prephenate dehydratase, partial [Gemmatimonadaceae bacterium]|nr:prephenate dehydratase [Gemmatimonadaceae bacterium]